MPGSTEYQCGECSHSFRVPQGMVRDARLLMCPACGSIDLNLITVQPAPAAIWTSREPSPAQERAEERESIAS